MLCSHDYNSLFSIHYFYSSMHGSLITVPSLQLEDSSSALKCSHLAMSLDMYHREVSGGQSPGRFARLLGYAQGRG